MVQSQSSIAPATLPATHQKTTKSAGARQAKQVELPRLPRRVEDVALAGPGEIDTIFVVGGSWAHAERPDSNSAGRPGNHRIGRFRRVVVHFIGVRDGHKILSRMALGR